MEFIEAPAFSRCVSEYLDDDEYAQLQGHLAANPHAGDLMPGTGGFQKLRWKDPRRGKGRRGGLRIIYYHFAADQLMWLLTLYGKDEASDLTPMEKTALKRALQAELVARRARKPARKGKK
jgi:hypothetical protein